MEWLARNSKIYIYIVILLSGVLFTIEAFVADVNWEDTAFSATFLSVSSALIYYVMQLLASIICVNNQNRALGVVYARILFYFFFGLASFSLLWMSSFNGSFLTANSFTWFSLSAYAILIQTKGSLIETDQTD